MKRTEGKSDTELGFIHLQGLRLSQLAEHLLNEINQDPCYLKKELHCNIQFLIENLKSNSNHGFVNKTFNIQINLWKNKPL